MSVKLEKKRTSATFIDGDGFPHYNYQNELSDTEECSTNRFKTSTNFEN